ncbi:TCR/Tet family MFS transporter [Caulobacter sp. S45]|uniref:TCR/Tet family MFS transporter n=1 Tax=Caulobacter sp. S45 TaxID=1641861 RepID=UPI00131AF99C|nr:TCR/Tet family MFS transporter [Caulobacter sp. S45]
MVETPPAHVDPLHTAPGSTLASGPPVAPGRHRAAVRFIFIVALLDILAIGVIVPVLPKLVAGFTGGDLGRAADYVGVFGAAWALMQFIFSPIQGALSDRFGRRPVLLISIFGLGADYVLMALAPSLAWLFLGRLISGITAASFSTANAYIADVTPPDKRAAAFGMMGAAFGIGFVLGPTLGGLCASVSPRLPFWVSAGLAFANGMYGLFVLPESLPKERRAPFRLANANPFGSFRLLAAYPGLLGLAGVMFLFFLAHQVLQSTMVLYADYRYHWAVWMMGALLAGVGICNIVVQGGIVRPFAKRFKERGAVYTGLLFAAAGMAIWGWAPSGLWFCLGVPVFSMIGLVQPGVQGMMTRRVGPNEQGRLQGANSAVMAMAGLVGPVMFTQVFHHSITGAHVHPGTPFYVAAGLLLLAFVLAMSLRRSRPDAGVRSTGEPAIVAP